MRSKIQLTARKRWSRFTKKSFRLCKQCAHHGMTIEAWNRKTEALFKVPLYRGMIPSCGQMIYHDRACTCDLENASPIADPKCPFHFPKEAQ